MAHPFEKMFMAALRKSTEMDNVVLKEALKLRDKGYAETEIAGVLKNLQAGLINDDQAEIVGEALAEFADDTV